MPASPKSVVLVSRPECLSCNRLTDLATDDQSDDKCHKRPSCPAKHLSITRGINMHETAERLRQAWASDNAEEAATILGKLAKCNDAVRSRVMALAKSPKP